MAFSTLVSFSVKPRLSELRTSRRSLRVAGSLVRVNSRACMPCMFAKLPSGLATERELPGFPKLQSHQCHQAPTGQLVSRQPRASGRGGVYIMLVYVIVEGGSSPATRPHVSRARPGRQAFLSVMECRVCLGDHVLLGSKGFPCPQIMQCGHGMVCMHLKRAGASKRGRCAVGLKIRSMPHICPSRALPCMPASIASLRLVFSLFFFRSHLNRSLMVAGILCGHPAFRSAPLAGQPAPFARRWAGSWVPPCLAGAFRFLRPIQDADPVIRLELAAGTLFPPGRDLWSAFLTR